MEHGKHRGVRGRDARRIGDERIAGERGIEVDTLEDVEVDWCVGDPNSTAELKAESRGVRRREAGTR